MKSVLPARRARLQSVKTEAMRAFRSFGVIFLFTLQAVQVQADGRPDVPEDYPSHKRIGSCNQGTLSRHLQHYNETRLDVADVLRHMADDQETSPKARSQLLGYAENLDQMRRQLPPPNPDSNEFQNFDFQLGITLTSMTLFLNTEDEQLAQRFVSDRDDPDSELGIYLVRLEDSRMRYMDRLAESRESDCRS